MMLPCERDADHVLRTDPWSRVAWYDTILPDPSPVAYWSTNIYNDFGRALSMLQWIREPRISGTNCVCTVIYTNVITSPILKTNGKAFGWSADDSFATWSYGSAANGTLTLQAMVSRYAVTNNRPFTIDNVCWPADSITTNDIVPATWDDQPARLTLAPYAGGESDWTPITPDDMSTWLVNFGATFTVGATGPVLLLFVPATCLHVQFQSLTNYLNHAPAR
jgi:hypothetical protein